VKQKFCSYYSDLHQGYKPGAVKSAEEYAKLDAEDESLARWKASLGIVPGATEGDTSQPKVGQFFPPLCAHHLIALSTNQVTVLTLELASPTLPPEKKIVFRLDDKAALADTKKNPIIIKEGVEYKYVYSLRDIASGHC